MTCDCPWRGQWPMAVPDGPACDRAGRGKGAMPLANDPARTARRPRSWFPSTTRRVTSRAASQAPSRRTSSEVRWQGRVDSTRSPATIRRTITGAAEHE